MLLTPANPSKATAGWLGAVIAPLRDGWAGWLATLLAIAATTSGWPAVAESTHSSHEVTQTAERVQMIVKSSRVLSLSDRIPRFQVHNEEILTATPISENQIQIFAKVPGSTELNLWDTNDQQYTVTITIIGDAREVEGVLNSQLPLASLKVTPVRESAILSGYVTTADDVERAVAITEQFYGVVINNIHVLGLQQVLLHTRMLEISRTKARDLGIDLAFFGDVFDRSASVLTGTKGVVFGDNSSGAFTSGISGNTSVSVAGRFNSLIEALEGNNVVKLLAEPTLISTHGRAANFNLGGRAPYVVNGGNGNTTVEYLPFGTQIDFIPFVVGQGRLRLELRAEVSELDESVGINTAGARVPGFRSRTVDTAVEMNAGETFAIAGLLFNRTEASVSRVPFFGSLPYAGALFRNITERKNEVELLIMVTPELVDAMAPHEVPAGGPGLNSHSPGQHEFYVDGHIEVPNLRGDRCGQPTCGPGIADGDIRYGVPPTLSVPQQPETLMEVPGEMILLPPQANATAGGRDGVASPAVRRGWGTEVRQASANASPRPRVAGIESATLIGPAR